MRQRHQAVAPHWLIENLQELRLRVQNSAQP